MEKRFEDLKDANAVHKSGDEAISGNKNFTSKIGIGTNTPKYKVEIIGETDDSAQGPLMVTADGSTTVGAGFSLDSTAVGGKLYSFVSGGTKSGVRAGNFGFFNGTDNRYVFQINDNGDSKAFGTMSATRFIGDGSGLTNLPAAIDANSVHKTGDESIDGNKTFVKPLKMGTADYYASINAGRIDLVSSNSDPANKQTCSFYPNAIYYQKNGFTGTLDFFPKMGDNDEVVGISSGSYCHDFTIRNGDYDQLILDTNYITWYSTSAGEIKARIGYDNDSGNMVFESVRVADPVNPTDIANKNYVDSKITSNTANQVHAVINDAYAITTDGNQSIIRSGAKMYNDVRIVFKNNGVVYNCALSRFYGDYTVTNNTLTINSPSSNPTIGALKAGYTVEFTYFT